MDKLLRNEQMFESVNIRMAEAMAHMAAQSQLDDFTLSLYCECANKACEDRIGIAFQTYSRIKKGEATFVVLPEHYIPQFEKLVNKTADYWVIQKMLEKLGEKFEI